MGFGALPPEVNSAKMYAGPGPGSMLVAAAAWKGMAEELYSASSSGHAVVSALTTEAWRGQASVSMATAAARYLAWLRVTAAQAEQTAAQLTAAASAFETAFAATVPPPLIAANRALLLLLGATNVLGINTPAIATVEAHYGEMWVQDAAAMYGYAGAAAAASTLAPFTPPDQAMSSLPQLTTLLQAVPQALQQLAAPATSGASTMSSSMSTMSSLTSVANTLGSFTAAASGEVNGLVPITGAGLFTALGGPQSTLSAEVGKAMSIGQLSVPQSWATPAQVAAPISRSASANPVVATTRTPNMLSGLPIAGPAPRGESAVTGATMRAGVRPTVMSRPPFGG